MCFRLTAEEKQKQGNLSGSVRLITEGLNVERAQYVFDKYLQSINYGCYRNGLKKCIASLGRHPTTAQKSDLIAKRDALQKRRAKFEKSMSSFIQKQTFNLLLTQY
jgi:hypothetical protein